MTPRRPGLLRDAASVLPPTLLARARALALPGQRALLGITGPPGAGKSTLAAALAQATDAVLVPMDGFHLADTELDRLGRRDRKGAPDTFDAAGFVALLRRLRAGEDVYAPVFRRELELAEAGARAVPGDAPLVVVEGNYLLCDGGFRAVREVLTECWYVELDPVARLDRLVARHVEHGRTPEQALAWASGTDEQNATLVASTRARADLVVRAP